LLQRTKLFRNIPIKKSDICSPHFSTNTNVKQLTTAGNTIFVCDGSKCSKHSKPVRKGLREAIKEAGLKDEIEVVKMECSDQCKHAPVVFCSAIQTWYGDVSPRDISTIVEAVAEVGA
jgi:(2Fe-2S) ferredoxin